MYEEPPRNGTPHARHRSSRAARSLLPLSPFFDFILLGNQSAATVAEGVKGGGRVTYNIFLWHEMKQMIRTDAVVG